MDQIGVISLQTTLQQITDIRYNVTNDIRCLYPKLNNQFTLETNIISKGCPNE